MELEAKFVVLARSTEDDLQVLDKLGSYALVPEGSCDLHDTYFDTPDHGLLAAGYAYRRRYDGNRTRLTLKELGNVQDGTLHQREEIEVVAPNQETRPIGPLAEQLQALGIDETFHPLFELKQQRFERAVLDRGRHIGTLSLDRVEFTGKQHALPFTELEFELGGEGEDTDLHRVIECLGAMKGLSPEPISKFSRGLVLAVGCQTLCTSGAYALDEKDAVADTFHKLAYPLICKLMLHEFGAYRGENIEGVHHMRVTARRLRTLVRIFRPYLRGSDEAKSAVRRLAKGFKRLTKGMGPVRDLDVFRERIEADFAHATGDCTSFLRILTRAWDGAYIPARNHLIHELERERHGDFKATLEAGLSSALTASEAQQPVARVIPEILEARLDAVRTWAHAAERQDASISALHSLRMAIKRLRYALEFLSPLLGPETDATIDRCIRIQDHLGDLKDIVFAYNHEVAVRSWGTWDLPAQPETLWHHVEAEPVPTAEPYLEAERQRRDHLRTTLPELWGKTAPAIIQAVSTTASAWRDKVSQIRYNHTGKGHLSHS